MIRWDALDDSATADLMRRWLQREPTLSEVTRFQQDVAQLANVALEAEVTDEEDFDEPMDDATPNASTS